MDSDGKCPVFSPGSASSPPGGSLLGPQQLAEPACSSGAPPSGSRVHVGWAGCGHMMGVFVAVSLKVRDVGLAGAELWLF